MLYNDNLGVEFKHVDESTAQFDKYNLVRYRRRDDKLSKEFKVSKDVYRALESIYRTVKKDKDESLDYEIMDANWNVIYNFIFNYTNIIWELPVEWRFMEITLEKYKIFTIVIEARAFIHYYICLKFLKSNKRWENTLMIFSKDEIINFIFQHSNLEVEEIKNILSIFTFNEKAYENNMDIQWKPFVELNDDLYALSANLIVVSNFERNLISLINKLDSKSYSNVSVEKENIMIEEISNELRVYSNLHINSNIKLPGRLPDIDFMVYDDISNSLLVCEFKWLLETDSVQELYARDKDLEKGLKQAEKTLKYSEENTNELLLKAYGENNYNVSIIYSCVVSMNTIGSTKSKSCINVIDKDNFCRLFKSNKGVLGKVIEIIKSGTYLNDSTPEVEYKFTSREFIYGDYSFRVPGVKVLEKNYQHQAVYYKKLNKKRKQRRNLAKKSRRINRKLK